MSGAQIVGANHVHRLVRSQKPLLTSDSGVCFYLVVVAEPQPPTSPKRAALSKLWLLQVTYAVGQNKNTRVLKNMVLTS